MTPRIAFSTLACPHWSVETIISNARAWGYDGIEWRGGDAGHINPSLSPAERAHLRQRMDEAGLDSVAVTSYTTFVSRDQAERQTNVDALRSYLDLAADIGARYVRAFVGELRPGQTFDAVYPYVIECFEKVVSHAHLKNVGIALEHHDDWVRTATLLPILQAVHDPLLGVVWDIANAYSAGEDPAEGERNLRGRIFYVQVKDGVGRRPDWRLTDVGAGAVPLRRAFELLQAGHYAGAFSLEWEYAWHPELTPPEQALPTALTTIQQLLAATYAGELDHQHNSALRRESDAPADGSQL